MEKDMDDLIGVREATKLLNVSVDWLAGNAIGTGPQHGGRLVRQFSIRRKIPSLSSKREIVKR